MNDKQFDAIKAMTREEFYDYRKKTDSIEKCITAFLSIIRKDLAPRCKSLKYTVAINEDGNVTEMATFYSSKKPRDRCLIGCLATTGMTGSGVIKCLISRLPENDIPFEFLPSKTLLSLRSAVFRQLFDLTHPKLK